MLAVLLDRLRGAQAVNEFVVATTDQSQDIAIAELAAAEGFACYRGSEDDVLDRFYQTARLHCADLIVRLTADNPLMDAELVDWLVNQFRSANPAVDYAALSPEAGFPHGLGGEIFTMRALELAWQQSTDAAQREHVTAFIYQHPELFRRAKLGCEANYSHLRVTVDTPADFELVRRIFTEIGRTRFPWREVPALLERQPDLLAPHAALS